MDPKKSVTTAYTHSTCCDSKTGIVFQCSSSDTKWIHGLQETVHDLWTSFFLKSSVALGMRRLAGRLHIETVKRSLRSRYATCQPTWAFQGPHETSETMMWADHELFWAAHVFIEDRRRSIERISRFKLLLSFDRPENGSISTLNRFLCLLNRSQKPWKCIHFVSEDEHWKTIQDENVT